MWKTIGTCRNRPLDMSLQKLFYQPSMSSKWSGVFTFNSKLTVPTSVLWFSTFGHCLQIYKRFCQRSWIKMERKWHYIWLVGISEWLMLRNSQLRSRGRSWRARIMWRNGMGKKNSSRRLWPRWMQCGKRPGLWLRRPQSSPRSATGSPTLPLLGLCVLACRMSALDQTRGLKTSFWLACLLYCSAVMQHPDL